MANIEMTTTPWPEEAMKAYQWLDEYLLEQPAVEKEFQPAWQAYKYLLRGKMFAYVGVNDKTHRPILTAKLEPAYSEMLRAQYADIEPGYYMNKLHWSSVNLDGEVPRAVLADIVLAAHKTMLGTLSKKARQEILGL